MFIKLERSDGIPVLINIESINSIVYQDPNVCVLYTNRNQLTLKESFDSIVEKFINLNIEIN